MTAFEVDDLSVRFGAVHAVSGVSLQVDRGSVVALLGANGAGKSSLLNAVSGMIPSTGTIRADGVDLADMPPERRAAHVAHVPEGRRLFPEHSVRENLLLGAFRAPRDVRRRRLEHVYEVLPRLSELARRRAGKLSGGEQQMVALGRGLMSGAPVLLIDELSLGLAPIIASSFVATLDRLRDEGLAILLVEQYMPLALSVADHAVVLERGRVTRRGNCEEMRHDILALQAAYLGEEPDPSGSPGSVASPTGGQHR